MKIQYRLALSTVACCLSALAVSARAATVWTGPTITFSKGVNVSPTLPSSQDPLTSHVILTRGTSAGMFNIAEESSFSATSPVDTLWATSINNPSQTITASNFAALTFDTWQNAFGGSGSLNSNITTHDAVVHLTNAADDIYLNLRFTSFDSGANNGSFTYQRSTPVPEPSAALLATIGAISLSFSRWRISPRGRRRSCAIS